MTVYLSVLCLIYMRGCSHLGKISSQEVNKVELSLEPIKKKKICFCLCCLTLKATEVISGTSHPYFAVLSF